VTGRENSTGQPTLRAEQTLWASRLSLIVCGATAASKK